MGVAVNDKRPLVKDLLDQHSSALAELRAILEKEDSYMKGQYDDIWMLRFLLTHKKVCKASVAAIRTMKFRREWNLNDLGDIRFKLLNHLDHQSDRHFEITKKHLAFCKADTAMMYAQPDRDRGLVQVISPGQIDMKSLAVGMSHEELMNYYVTMNETIYQVNDEVTRRTGKLTKLLRIMDCSGIISKSFSPAFSKQDAAITKHLQDFYPQMLGRIIVSDMPSIIGYIWRMLKPILPRRVVEKVTFTKPGKESDSKEYLDYISNDHLWARYGGSNGNWPIKPPSHLWENQQKSSCLENCM